MYYNFILSSILILFITIALVVRPSYVGFKIFGFAEADISKLPSSFPSSGPEANLTMHNTTGTISLVGDRQTSDLPRPQFKPFVDIKPNESYLTRDYATYKAEKNQSESIKPDTRVFKVQLPSPHNSSSIMGVAGFGRQDKVVHFTTSHDFIVDDNRHAAGLQINQSGSLTGFEGLAQNCCDPPDIQVAAGSNYVMEMVNLDAAVYTKSGTLVKGFGLDQFFSPSDSGLSKSDNLSDPSLLFDSQAGRWFASISDITAHSIRVAISKTDNPTGFWRIYDFPFGFQPNNCSDQPFIGVSSDKFVVAVNNWDNNCDWYSNNRPPEFGGVQFTVTDKSDLINGLNSVRSMQSKQNFSYFSLHPVVTLSPTSALLIATVGDLNYKKVQVLYVDGPISNLHIRSISDHIQTTHVPPDGIQPATNNKENNQCCNSSSTNSDRTKEHKVSTGDARIQSAVWYRGKLRLAFNDGCFVKGDTKSRSCIRFIELDTIRNRISQDFDVAAAGASLYFPAMSIDKAGDLGIIFGYSSSSSPSSPSPSLFLSAYPGLLVSKRLTNDIPNSIEQPQTLKLGTANVLSNRFGDYFAASSDPSEDSTIWLAGQYHAVETWSTYIGHLYMPR
jgi:hypothetical protein